MTAEDSTKKDEKIYSWRSALSIVVLCAGCLLVMLSVVGIWTRNLVLDTDRYTETVAPLSQDEAIDNAVADRVTNELFTSVDVEGRLHDAFPDQIKFLASPLSDRMKQYTRDTTYDVLKSDEFNKLWIDANHTAHDAIVTLLTGNGDVVKATEGKVVLDLNPVIDDVVGKMGDTGQAIFGKISPDEQNLQFVIFESQTLANIQGAVDLIQKLAVVLPVLALAALVGTVLLFYDRRRSLFFIGLGVSISMVLLLVALALLRSTYLDSVAAADLSVDAAESLFDTMVRFLRDGIRIVFMVGLLLAAGAWLFGPAKVAVRIREISKSGFMGLGKQVERAGKGMGPVGEWISENKRLLQTAGGAVVFLVLVWGDWPVRSDIIWLAVILAVYLFVVEFLGRAGEA